MRLMDFRPSELALLAWSSPISSSLISPSSCFLTRRASPLALCSASMEAPRDSMARAWFFLVLLNSSSFSANRLSDISKLQLGAEDLVLLHLEGSLGLLQGALQLLLLGLQHAALFVKSVDGATALTQLVEQILDLVSEVLVLPLDNVELLSGLLLGGLQAEQLGGVVAALVLRGVNLGSEVSGLGLPLTENLVEVLGSLLSDKSSGVDSLVLHGEVVKISGLSALGLLGVGDLGGEDVNELLVLHNLGLQLVASSLKLLNAAHSLGLKARLPQLSLSLVLGQSLQGVRLAHGLILKLLPEVLQVSGHHLVLGQQGGAVLGLGVRQGLGVLQLGGHGDLGLVHVGDGVLQLLNLSVEVLVLNLQTLLGGLGLIESSGHLVQLSLGLDGVLQVEAGVSQVQLQSGLVLLRLHLVGVQLVDLLAEVGHGVVVLHPESGQGALLGDVELLQLCLQSGQLSLSLLVELHLGGGVGVSQ